MQKQSSLKVFVVVFSICVLNVPIISAKKQHKSSGQATTRSPPQTQAPAAQAPAPAPNNDAAKLSYGNQHSPPQNNNNQPPPSYQQSHNGGGPPPAYSANPQPGYQPQPSYKGHPGGYQQSGPPQQSSGGIGTAGGLAIGALGGAVGGYALSQALSDKDDEKKEESTTATTTTVAGATTTSTAPTTTLAGFSTTAAHTENTTMSPTADSTTMSPTADSTTPFIFVTSLLSSNETTLSSISTSTETTTAHSWIATPSQEALVESKNATSSESMPKSDGIAAKLSLNLVLLSVIFRFAL